MEKNKTSTIFISYREFISTLSDDVLNEKSVFLLGAGISMVKPTSLPSGKQMKEIVFETLITYPKFKKDKANLKKNVNYNKIIPEVLFSEIYSIIGNNIFCCFNILRNGNSNSLHRLFAVLINKFNSTILTTNFDLFIDELLLPKKEIYHLHGHLNDIENIYILLGRIGRGINFKFKVNLEKQIQSKNIYILGYSGNDKDILELLSTCTISNIYWLVMKGEEDIVISNAKVLKNKNISFCYGDLNTLDHDIYTHSPDIKKYQIKPVNRPNKNLISTNDILKIYQNNVNEIQSVLCLLQVYYRLGNFKRIVELGTQILKKQEDIPLTSKLSLIIRVSETMRLIPSGYEPALKLINSALNDKNTQSHYLYSELLNSKGIILHSQFEKYSSNINKALTLFKQSIYFQNNRYKKIQKNNIVEKEKILVNISLVYNNIGLCYYEAEDYQNAEIFLKKSLGIKRKLGHINGQISTMYNLCILAYKSNKKSYSYWEKRTNTLIDKYNVHYRKVGLLKDIGLIMIGKGLIEEGLKKLDEALKITNEYIPDFVINEELREWIRKYRNK